MKFETELKYKAGSQTLQLEEIQRFVGDPCLGLLNTSNSICSYKINGTEQGRSEAIKQFLKYFKKALGEPEISGTDLYISDDVTKLMTIGGFTFKKATK